MTYHFDELIASGNPHSAIARGARSLGPHYAVARNGGNVIIDPCSHAKPHDNTSALVYPRCVSTGFDLPGGGGKYHCCVKSLGRQEDPGCHINETPDRPSPGTEMRRMRWI